MQKTLNATHPGIVEKYRIAFIFQWLKLNTNRRWSPCRLMLYLFTVVFSFLGCDPSSILPEKVTKEKHGSPLQTENVVVVVIDGPRFSETWGHPTKQYTPFMGNVLAKQGVHYDWFYNNGPSYTSSGHTALTTGKYQIMQNDGSEFPQYPSFFQYWLNSTQSPPHLAGIITGKEKLHILADCSDLAWRGKFNPNYNAANREDSETFDAALNYFNQHQPRLALIHFRGPDHNGHSNNWGGYLDSIMETDSYVHDLWGYLQENAFYRNKTTMFVTNDHGRHLDNVRDGFVSHGDFCEGCLHINLFAIGPDFKAGVTIDQHRELIDIAPTIAKLMHFNFPESRGNVLNELFK